MVQCITVVWHLSRTAAGGRGEQHWHHLLYHTTYEMKTSVLIRQFILVLIWVYVYGL